jgi:hypothetical protein
VSAFGFGIIRQGLYRALPPVAVDTSFTFTGSGAAQANLYDGNDATMAADGGGTNVNMHAAYDLGALFTVRRVRFITAPTTGFSVAIVFNIGLGVTSLTTGFTNVGTLSVTAGLSQLSVVDFTPTQARYVRLFYASGTTGGNAWAGELSFYDFA